MFPFSAYAGLLGKCFASFHAAFEGELATGGCDLLEACGRDSFQRFSFCVQRIVCSTSLEVLAHVFSCFASLAVIGPQQSQLGAQNADGDVGTFCRRADLRPMPQGA